MTHAERSAAAGAIPDREEAYRIAAAEIRGIVEGEPNLIANLANAVAILRERHRFFWVGIYRFEGGELVLGPFQGTTACTRIASGRGVCGAAVARGEPILVPDVHAFPGHIACDARSRSEVVVPIRDARGAIRGVIDVDSDLPGAFGPGDVRGLEEIAAILGSLWPEAVSETEERFRLLAENSTDMISRHTLDGTYLYASPACRVLLGYSPEELVGRQGFELLHEEDIPLVRAAHDKALGDGEPGALIYRLRRKDGEYRWFESTGRTRRDPETGEPLEIIAVTRDVGVRKEAEDERRRLLLELAHAGRVAVMGEMGSGLAHELNQPLAAISNYLEVGIRSLDAASPQSDRTRLALEAALHETRRAGQIIQWIRGFVRRGEMSRAPVSAKELVHEVVNLASWEIQRGLVEVQIELDPAPDLLEADRVQIQQVLLNLLRNALEAIGEASPPVRRVVIRTRVTSEGHVEFAVTDTGIGLSEEARKHLFEPFYTTKEQGLGLGLAISRSIVEAHGGTLAVGSWPDPGASFVFALPRAPQANAG